MRIVSKFCAFTVHETPTKDLWRFVKYYSQFSSDEFYLLFLRKFSWLMHNGFVWFLHCILYLGWQSKARKRENVGKCTSLQVCFECIFSLRKKDEKRNERKYCSYMLNVVRTRILPQIRMWMKRNIRLHSCEKFSIVFHDVSFRIFTYIPF